jgi:hypothetical protein
VLFGIGRYLYNLDEVWVNVTERRSSTHDIYVSQKDKRYQSKDVKGYFTPPTLPNWALPEKYNVQKEEKHQTQSNSNSTVQNTKTLPPGLVECVFKGMVVKTGHNNQRYYEIGFESNEELCVIYAIGEMVERIDNMQLEDNDLVAISTEQLKGEWVLNNIVKVS